MALDALSRPAPLATNAMSSYKAKKEKPPNEPREKAKCSECSAEMDKIVWNQRQGRYIEPSMCLNCWRKTNSRKQKANRKDTKPDNADETSALMVGAIETSAKVKPKMKKKKKRGKPQKKEMHDNRKPSSWRVEEIHSMALTH